MKIIIYDFEVFKYDTLFGAIILSDNGSEVYQTWDLNEIKNFYLDNQESIWVGHNIKNYDNLILEAIVKNKNIFETSQSLINAKFKPKCRLKLYYWDLMDLCLNPYSLKVTELYDGKNISESEIDFNLDRALTEEEKLMTESYNRDDLYQSLSNFNETQSQFKMRLDILSQFNLPLEYLSKTGTQIAAICLNSKAIPGIEYSLIKPHLYENLQLKNKELIDFYLTEKFRTKEKLIIKVGGVEQHIGSGGIHSAIECYHTKKALYFDVSGYYNLTMINYDLLPRTLPPESKEKYIEMYHEQLRLKKIDPVKRGVLKTILLAVFGAMNNEYTDFYDPQKCLLVTITGQLFIVDLMEKLEPYAKIVQSNTDGIIVEPFDWKDEEKVISIVEEWEKRTGYTIKKDHITDVWQRDVNCYCYKKDGEIHVVGESVRMYEQWQHMFIGNFFDSKEPAIFAYAIVNYLINKIKPEETIKKYKRNLRMFQFVCKKKSFDYTEIEQTDINTGDVQSIRLQGVNRAFASNDENIIGVIYKCRKEGKVKRARVQNLPDNVFVYDNEIISDKTVDNLINKINYQYYIDRAYEKILDFTSYKQIKELYL